MSELNLEVIATETGPGVFHARSWPYFVSSETIQDLIDRAKLSESRKARLCLHSNPNETMQITYLAFIAPYKDELHRHPHRAEALFPIIGKAVRRIYDSFGIVLREDLVSSESAGLFCTKPHEIHSLEVLSDVFVMLEVGSGPFLSDSTVYLGRD